MWNLFDLLGSLVLPSLVVLVACIFTPWLWRGFKAVLFLHIEYRKQIAQAQQAEAEAKILRLPPGNVVVPYNMIAQFVREQFVATAAYHVANATALPASVPHTITYSPHIRQMPTTERAQFPAPTPDTVADVIPTAMECYHRGMLDDATQLHVGFDQNMRPLYSPIEDTYGVSVAGMPKMGKTTGMRYWAMQMALHGAQMAFIDPAANSPSQQGLAASMSGLRNHLWEQPASEPDAIVKMLRRIDAMGTARNQGQDTSRWPLMLMVDEMTQLVTGERGDEIADLIKRIARQYRKEHLYVVAAGQDWLGDAMGKDVGLRRAFVCKAVYRVDSENGRRLMIRKPLIDMVPALQRGQMIWIDAGADQSLVSVPDCSSAAVAAILGTSGAPQKDFHTGRALISDGVRSGPKVGVEVGVAVDGEVVLDPGKMRQIQDYGAQSWSTHKIVGVVFGVKGGSAYGPARELVNQVLGREV